MNYVITTMPTNLHAGLSPSLSVIWWQGDALLLSAWHLEPYVPPNESAISERWFPKGFRTGAAVKSSEREDSQSLRSLSQLCSEAEKCRDWDVTDLAFLVGSIPLKKSIYVYACFRHKSTDHSLHTVDGVMGWLTCYLRLIPIDAERVEAESRFVGYVGHRSFADRVLCILASVAWTMTRPWEISTLAVLCIDGSMVLWMLLKYQMDFLDVLFFSRRRPSVTLVLESLDLQFSNCAASCSPVMGITTIK